MEKQPTNKRKQFLKALAAGIIGLPVGLKLMGGDYLAQAQTTDKGDQRTFKWKMVTTWPPNFPILDEGARLLADWVREMSQGRLDIHVYGGGELVPPLECFDTVRSGAADIASGVSYYWAGKIPAAQFFASVPFGMNAQQVNAWLIGSGALEKWQALYKPYNLLPFPGGNTGVQMGGWFNREINSIADLKGLKMRIPGLGGKILEKVGGAPILIPGGELYTSLERGVIDATEWLSPFHDFQMGFQEIAKYYYYPGWHEPGTALEIICNLEKFNVLPPDLQEILKTAIFRLNHWTLSMMEAKNTIYLKKIRTETKVEIKAFPAEVMDSLRKAALEYYEEMAQNDPAVKSIYKDYKQFQTNAMDWANISEKEYYRSIEG